MLLFLSHILKSLVNRGTQVGCSPIAILLLSSRRDGGPWFRCGAHCPLPRHTDPGPYGISDGGGQGGGGNLLPLA